MTGIILCPFAKAKVLRTLLKAEACYCIVTKKWHEKVPEIRQIVPVKACMCVLEHLCLGEGVRRQVLLQWVMTFVTSCMLPKVVFKFVLRCQ